MPETFFACGNCNLCIGRADLEIHGPIPSKRFVGSLECYEALYCPLEAALQTINKLIRNLLYQQSRQQI